MMRSFLSIGEGQREPSARRKRRCPGTVSIHAILLLVACSNTFPFHRNGRLPMAEALVAPSPPMHSHWFSRQKRILKSRVLSKSSLSATSAGADESVSTRSKGQTTQKSTTTPPKRRRSKQKSRRRNKKNTPGAASPPGPWDADYDTSVRTQRRIQSAAYGAKGSAADHVGASRAVLRTLLGSPPEECNAANLVCALTLSSKTLARRRGGRRNNNNNNGISMEDEEGGASFRTSLVETLSILRTLVAGRRLTPRQLCNAAWAIAKHVEYDPTLFSRGRKQDGFVYVKDTSTWDLSKQRVDAEDEDETDALIEEVLDSIALCVIDHLEERRSGRSIGVGKKVRPGELCMLLWAYAAAKPRDRPPGWERPRRMERLSNGDENAIEARGDDNVDFVTFTELKEEGSASRSDAKSFDDEMQYDMKYKQPAYQSTTSKLFDAAAIAFCRGEGAAARKGLENETTLLRSCTWSELSNIAWSYATRGACSTRESEAMMSFLAREATRRIRRCTRGDGPKEERARDILPRDVTQIAWALGTMESDNVNIGDALVRLVDAINDYWTDGRRGEEARERPLARWTCADLVQMATALAHGRLDNRSMLRAVYEESLERLAYDSEGPRNQRIFTTGEISILAWVQARLYLTPKFGEVYGEFPGGASRALLERMRGRSSRGTGSRELEGGEILFPATTMRQKGLGPQEQANLAWSLTVLEDYDEDVVSLLRNIFHAASSSAGDDEGLIQLEHAHQLWQSYFLLSGDCPDAVGFVPDEFARYLEEKWNVEKGRRKRSSGRHAVISKTLDLMRVAHRNEYDEDVDVAIVLGEDSAWTHTAIRADLGTNRYNDYKAGHVKVAMEFDGPHHFTVTASTGEDLAAMENGAKLIPRVLGHTVLKYRLLKKKGWTVVRIPYYEFDKIPFWASMERQRYLQRALKTHDKIVFSDIDVSEYKAMPPTRHSRFD